MNKADPKSRAESLDYNDSRPEKRSVKSDTSVLSWRPQSLVFSINKRLLVKHYHTPRLSDEDYCDGQRYLADSLC